MSVEVGQKKATGQSAQSAQSDEPMHRGDKVHRTVRLHEKTALCDKSVWSSLEREAQRSITAAGRREAPQRQAPPDVRTGQSAEACLSREVPADHVARSRTQRGQLRGTSAENSREL